MNAHTVLWTSPVPLWGRFGAFTAADQSRPAILRFASDEFMEQLLAMLAADPKTIGDVIARPETWRTPGGETPDLVERVPLPRIAKTLARLRRAEESPTQLAATANAATTIENNVSRTVTLKLYQPAHQRHYLVAANLVCGLPGFPDRAIATGGREQVGFVLRRMLVPTGGTSREEFAFIKDKAGARWQRLGAATASDNPAARLADGEDVLPLFPLNFRDDTTHQRRLLAGVIPVGRREEYMSTRAQQDPQPPPPPAGTGSGQTSSTDPTSISARKEQLKGDVTEPWKNLVRTARGAVARLNTGTPPPNADPNPNNTARKRVNHQLQMQSWLLLLDFADYLSLHLPKVWDAVVDPARRANLSDNGKRLFDWMSAAGTGQTAASIPIDTGSRSFAANLCDALKKVRENQATRDGIEGAVASYPDDPNDPSASPKPLAWPSFLFLLAHVGPNGVGDTTVSGIHESLPTSQSLPEDVKADEMQGGSTAASQQLTETSVSRLDVLVQYVVTAIDTTKPAAPTPPLPFAVTLREALKTTQGDEGWFVLRCVYVRCDCGPLQPALLSAPSQQFQLASFFDPDAPARPIRIALPVDTTPAGLRKFNKNTALVMSDVLCGQVQRAKGLGFIDLVLSVLPWPLHKDLDVPGMGPCTANGATIGMICSLSIPIITICALILLIIIVSLLDLIFRWLPFFIICFPVPGLKAKLKPQAP